MEQHDEDARPPAGLTEPFSPPVPRPGIGAGAAALLGVFAALALWAAFAGVGPAALDAAALADTIADRSGGSVAVARTITDVGSTWSMALLAVAVGAWCWVRGRRIDAAFMILTWAGGALLGRALKAWFARPRPPAADQLVHLTNPSLPSGHAMMATVVIGSLVVLAWRGRGALGRVVMVACAVAWVGAVGYTRIHLGAHWFSDVVAGWLVGAAWLAVCVAVWSWWRVRHPEPTVPVEP